MRPCGQLTDGLQTCSAKGGIWSPPRVDSWSDLAVRLSAAKRSGCFLCASRSHRSTSPSATSRATRAASWMPSRARRRRAPGSRCCPSWRSPATRPRTCCTRSTSSRTTSTRSRCLGGVRAPRAGRFRRPAEGDSTTPWPLRQRAGAAASITSAGCPTTACSTRSATSSPAQAAGLTELGGDLFGETICEDIWVPELAAEAAEQGAEVLFNISASPFHAGKGAEREQMLRQRARDNGVWLAYCNLVGGQDELVFDGRSVVIAPSGEVVARGASFAEDLVIADFTPGAKLGGLGGRRADARGPSRRCTRRSSSASATTCARTASRTWCSASRAASTPRSSPRSPPTRSGRSTSTACSCPAATRPRAASTDSRRAGRGTSASTRSQLPVEAPFQAFLDTLAPGLRGPRARRRPRRTCRRASAARSDGALQQVRLAAADDRQQERARGGLLDALRRHGRRLRADQGRVQDARLRPGAVAQRARPAARSSRRRSSTKPPSAELRPDQIDQDSLPPYPVLDAILRPTSRRTTAETTSLRLGFPAEWSSA